MASVNVPHDMPFHTSRIARCDTPNFRARCALSPFEYVRFCVVHWRRYLKVTKISIAARGVRTVRVTGMLFLSGASREKKKEMNIAVTRVKLLGEMRNIIMLHLALGALLSSAFLTRKHSDAVLAAITANMAIMGERVWAVQKRALFMFQPWVQQMFVASRSLVLGIYTGAALVWGVHALVHLFQ